MTTVITSAPDTGNAAPNTAFAHDMPALRISPFNDSGGVPSPAFEAAFVEQLSHHRGGCRPAGEPRRAAITVLATALRSANSLSQVLTVARGLSAGELLVAYDTVDGLRRDSVAALDELVADPTPARFTRLAPRIERLFPALVSALRSVAHDPRVLAERIAESERHGDRVHRDVAEVEARLSGDDVRGRAVLGVLDDGHDAGLYHEPTYRPQRVGDIVPSRLASLLATEEPEDEQ